MMLHLGSFKDKFVAFVRAFSAAVDLCLWYFYTDGWLYISQKYTEYN